MCKSNIEAIKAEVKELKEMGRTLLLSFLKDYGTEEDKDYVIRTGRTDIPSFKFHYQTWYSKSYRLIKQIIPDRATDFSNLYEYPRVRKNISFQNYTIKDTLQGLIVGNGIVSPKDSRPEFIQQLSIFDAAYSTLDSTINNMVLSLQSNIFDSEIESATNLKKAGHLRAAGAICGVLIEKHLLSVCQSHNIKISKKHPSISDLNEKLKSEKLLEHTQWRHIQLMADIRNICSHAKEKEPTNDQIDDLINGTNKIMKSIS